MWTLVNNFSSKRWIFNKRQWFGSLGDAGATELPTCCRIWVGWLEWITKCTFRFSFTHTLTGGSCWTPRAVTQHTGPRVRGGCMYTRASVSAYARRRAGEECESEAPEEQGDEGSGFWLKYNLWRSHSLSWQPSASPGGERGWATVVKHTDARRTPKHKHTQRSHQRRAAQTDRWANLWLTVCYETLSLCQGNQNNIFVCKRRACVCQHNTTRPWWMHMDGDAWPRKKKMFCC